MRTRGPHPPRPRRPSEESRHGARHEMQLGPSLHRLGSSSLVNSYVVEPHSSQRQAEPRSWIWSCGSCFPATQDAGASTVRLAPWRWRVARRGRGAAIVLGVLPASAGSPKLRGACPGAPSSRGERAAGGRATRHRRYRPGDLPTAVAPSERTRRLTDPSAALRGPFPWGDPLADGLIGVVAAMGVPGSQDARSAHPLALEQERLGESQRL